MAKKKLDKPAKKGRSTQPLENKRGRVSNAETEYILLNASKMTPEDIAKQLRRTPVMVREFLASRGLDTEGMDVKKSEKFTIRTELRTSQKWKRLLQELTSDEVAYFEQEYLRLREQFRNDVLPSEETQIFDVIRLELIKSRNLVEKRKARDEIDRLEKLQESLTKKWGDPSEWNDQRRAYMLAMQTQLESARGAEQSRTNEFVKLQERQDALTKALKGNREQRIKEIETGKDTILGLLKRLNRDESFRRDEGRQAELMRMAADKEYDRLGQYHEYEDGEVDRPILSPETVEFDDESRPVSEKSEE